MAGGSLGAERYSPSSGGAGGGKRDSTASGQGSHTIYANLRKASLLGMVLFKSLLNYTPLAQREDTRKKSAVAFLVRDPAELLVPSVLHGPCLKS